MEFSGEYIINAPRQKVWEALNDPEVLRQAIPGCQEIEKTSDTEMSATVKIKIGPVQATFKGKVTLSDLDPPNGYTITGEGQGGVAGFAKGGAQVTLSDGADGATIPALSGDRAGRRQDCPGRRAPDRRFVQKACRPVLRCLQRPCRSGSIGD